MLTRHDVRSSLLSMSKEDLVDLILLERDRSTAHMRQSILFGQEAQYRVRDLVNFINAFVDERTLPFNLKTTS